MIDYKIESADWLLPPDMEVVEYEIYYNENEVWRDICFVENGIEWDFTGLYQVSNFGHVKSLNYRNTGKEQIIKARTTRGYENVVLCNNGKQKHSSIHRLVAHMFLSDSYFEGAEVDHIDTNPLNNHVSNLRWCTRKENNNNKLTLKHYSEANKGENNPMYGRTGENHPMYGKKRPEHSERIKGKNNPMYGVHRYGENSPRARKIVSVDPLTKQPIFIWQYKKQATDFYGINGSTLIYYLKGKAKSGHLYNGFLWYYLDEYELLNN